MVYYLHMVFIPIHYLFTSAESATNVEFTRTTTDGLMVISGLCIPPASHVEFTNLLHGQHAIPTHTFTGLPGAPIVLDFQARVVRVSSKSVMPQGKRIGIPRSTPQKRTSQHEGSTSNPYAA